MISRVQRGDQQSTKRSLHGREAEYKEVEKRECTVEKQSTEREEKEGTESTLHEFGHRLRIVEREHHSVEKQKQICR